LIKVIDHGGIIVSFILVSVIVIVTIKICGGLEERRKRKRVKLEVEIWGGSVDLLSGQGCSSLFVTIRSDIKMDHV
jgi:hypothetical protein